MKLLKLVCASESMIHVVDLFEYGHGDEDWYVGEIEFPMPSLQYPLTIQGKLWSTILFSHGEGLHNY